MSPVVSSPECFCGFSSLPYGGLIRMACVLSVMASARALQPGLTLSLSSHGALISLVPPYNHPPTLFLNYTQ